MMTQERHGDIVTLTPAAAASVAGNGTLWNDDLRPCTLSEHSWAGSKCAFLWIGMCLCVPTYSLASGMIALGMNWFEAVAAIFTGSVAVLIPILLVSHAGTKFGIPYPVFARLWFGTRGAHLPSIARAIIAAGWFGINSWFGGGALDAIIGHLAPGWVTLPAHVAIAFGVFWLANVLVAMRGPQAIRRLAEVAAPTVAIGVIALLIWAATSAGGFGPMLATPATLHGAGFWAAFFGAVIGVISFWATLALNIPDFTRYARTQRGQLLGQTFSMPFTMAIFAFVGIAVTSATVILFGKPLWNPIDLIVLFPTPVVIIAGLIVMLSSITINVGANVMAPARAFENLWPARITFAMGAIFTGILSLLMQPWYFLSGEFSHFIFDWLGTYGALLGPIDGVAIADYWLVRARRLDLLALYSTNGRYDYSGGFNIRAIAAVAIGWAVALLGLVVAPLHFLWVGGWLFGLLGGLIAYALLMRGDASVLDATAYAEVTGDGS
jgi:NCS1 family nucleobase:cation symporter-1